MPNYGKVKVNTLTYDSSGSAVDLAVGDIAPKANPTFTGTITGATAVLTGDLTVDTNTLKVDTTNNKVGIGLTSPETQLEVLGSVWTKRNTNDPYAEQFRGRKDRAGSIVQDNDAILNFLAQGYDGSTYRDVAKIGYEIDGTPGSSDMPGRLVFATTSDGGVTPVERFRITSAGSFGIAGTNYGSSGQVLTSGGASAAPSWADAGGGAFAEYDAIWLGGDDTYLSADRWGNNHLGSGGSRGTLTRVTNLTPVGSGLTISTSGTSGYITFPSTGLWKIDWHTQIQRDTAGNYQIEMRVFSSTDSGSNFAQITPKTILPMDVPSGYTMLANHVFFYNVTNASTQRIFLAMYNSVGYDFLTSKNTMIEFSKLA